MNILLERNIDGYKNIAKTKFCLNLVSLNEQREIWIRRIKNDNLALRNF